jgi:multicomponent Na+:H+ antiporter subunit G
LNLLSLLLIGLGLVFWFWGSWPLLGRGSFLSKLHTLSVADNLGSARMRVGLLLTLPRTLCRRPAYQLRHILAVLHLIFE